MIHSIRGPRMTADIVKDRDRQKRNAVAAVTEGLGYVVVSPQIHLLVFDAAPEPLDKDIIPPSPFAVHADGDVVVDQHAGEGLARELRALIRVEDLRPAVLRERLLQHLDAELR